MSQQDSIIRAVIFDLDGTLVDSRLDFHAMREEIGAPANIGLLEYIDELDSDEAQHAAAVVHRHELAGAEAATWMPGAEQTLQTLHKRQVPLAIVTRNSRQAATRTMSRLGIPAMPLMAREDAPAKPDPAALLAIAAGWQMTPADCAYVGDFHYDITAAKRAGMLPVLYTPSATASTEADDAVWVIREFHSLLQRLELNAR